MALRTSLGCLLAALALSAACKKDGDKTQGSASDLDQRCEQLGKGCGDSEKHNDKIADGCKQAGKRLADKGCAAQASAFYDCYERELCRKTDKVWAFDDLRVLAERKNVCTAERNALGECLKKK